MEGRTRQDQGAKAVELKVCGGSERIVAQCPASPERRRPSAASFRPRTHSDGPVSQTLLTSDFKRRELLRAFGTLDDSTPQ